MIQQSCRLWGDLAFSGPSHTVNTAEHIKRRGNIVIALKGAIALLGF